MRNIIKVLAVAVVLALGLIAFFFTGKTETQTLNPVTTPAKIPEGTAEVAGYKSWTKVNDKPQFIASQLSALCTRPTREQIANKPNPHTDNFINVYVNSVGKTEMLTKKNPKFPVGTVVVKEKLASRESQTPELLTVMVKREAGFNPEVGDWEFMTLDGQATEVTSKGKLESCQSCHLGYPQNDFITRIYLPAEIRQKLQ